MWQAVAGAGAGATGPWQPSVPVLPAGLLSPQVTQLFTSSPAPTIAALSPFYVTGTRARSAANLRVGVV